MSTKKSELSLCVRNEIISLHKRGESYRKIGNSLNLSFSTVRNVIKKFKDTGSVENKTRSGRPQALTIRQRRDIVKEAIKNPFVSAKSLAVDIATYSGKEVSAQTVRNVLHSAEIYGRAARKKPFINEKNREKRFGFAKIYINKTMEFWKTVIFSDESKFNLFGSDGKRFVWRKPNTELNQKNVIPTVKHGGGHVMVWGCMSYHGVGNLVFIDGNMNADDYINVLRNNLLSSATKMGIDGNFLFQQDNDPKHTARKTREWLLYNVPKQLPTPPQSPDINPIENLWHIIDLKIRKNKIKNKNDLKATLLKEWSNISSEITQKLVESMPNRLQAVINAKGMHTKY
ncbi:Transposable element Tc1 transposase [Anthophora quadrimaculata]